MKIVKEKIFLIVFFNTLFNCFGQTTIEDLKVKIDLVEKKQIKIEKLQQNIIDNIDYTISLKEFEYNLLEESFQKIKYSIDSLDNVIHNYNVSVENLNSYHILKGKELIDQNSLKYFKYLKLIKKQYNLKHQEIVLLKGFFYIVSYNQERRIVGLEKKDLFSKLIDKQIRLMNDGGLRIVDNLDLYLYNSTGVNSSYLIIADKLLNLKNKLNELNQEKDKIIESRSVLFIIKKFQEDELTEKNSEINKVISTLKKDIKTTNIDPKPEKKAKILTPTISTTDVKITSGNSDNKTNSSTSTEASTNYFGDGGSSLGKGSGFGTDNDHGSGSGPGGGGGRIRYGDPNTDNIYSDEPQTIYLKLTVNAEGEVVGGKSTSKTTTTDQRIINQVLTNVKSQVRYSKKPGASLEFVYLTVNVRAN